MNITSTESLQQVQQPGLAVYALGRERYIFRLFTTGSSYIGKI